MCTYVIMIVRYRLYALYVLYNCSKVFHLNLVKILRNGPLERLLLGSCSGSVEVRTIT